MSERREFCMAAERKEVSFKALCAEYGISRKTGYKWLGRYQEGGVGALKERSRRPHTSPRQTPERVEAAVLAVREENPAWGGRKIAWVLECEGVEKTPAPSTVTAILRRHGQVDPAESVKHKPCQRFAMEKPNELWQMDFKGQVELEDGMRCYPLTVLDDHSRFLLALQACGDASHTTVQQALTVLFRTYGLPERILTDHGAPWGFGPALSAHASLGNHTRLTLWLLRLDIAVSHGRIRHPQTQGKDERLHRTLEAELLAHTPLASLADSQAAFDGWRTRYNQLRPHEALLDDASRMQVPAARYSPSLRPFPDILPPIVYDEGACLRKVDSTGRFYFQNRKWRAPKPLCGELVAIVPTPTDGCFAIYYGRHPVAFLDLHQPATNRD